MEADILIAYSISVSEEYLQYMNIVEYIEYGIYYRKSTSYYIHLVLLY